MLTASLSLSQAIENIDTLTSLESLFLGKNKITKLQNLDALTNLTVLSMQVLTPCPPTWPSPSRDTAARQPARLSPTVSRIDPTFTTSEQVEC